MDNPAIYVFDGHYYCKWCMDAVNVGWRRRTDALVAESRRFLKLYKSGKYLAPREDIRSYGKKDKS
jgi:hypothetical protein